jgi:hypothetical protein
MLRMMGRRTVETGNTIAREAWKVGLSLKVFYANNGRLN